MARDADVDMTIHLVLLATDPIASEPTGLTASLRYAARDPYAAALHFPAGSASTPVTWTFDRELLLRGARERAGDGDVRVWPAGDRPDATYIELSAPAGRALFAAPTAALQLFIDATTTLVPIGSESIGIDIDAELQAILGTVL